MACAGCSVGNREGRTDSGGCSTGGCGSTGCGSGGCNRLNTHDWLANVILPDTETFNLAEISFKNGARKNFYHCPAYLNIERGDLVLVEADGGFDIGQVSLMGELVRIQLKKRKVRDSAIFAHVIRKANDRDIERLDELRAVEKETMIRARLIAYSLNLDMKMGDVEYQADGRKATFYYTADGRVDFRELIRHYARDFRVKIEMRQIGARQEAARIGGIGSCGRELCCSTWLTDFKSVGTSAARYQNLAINQTKLSGQCGRLKCCLNFELDAYVEAVGKFPRNNERLRTKLGDFNLLKIDVFKGVLHYGFRDRTTSLYRVLTIAQVLNVQEQLAKGIILDDLITAQEILDTAPAVEIDYDRDLTNIVELPAEKRKRKKKKDPNSREPRSQERPPQSREPRPPRNNADSEQQRPPQSREPRPPRQDRARKSSEGENQRPPQSREPRPPRNNEQGEQQRPPQPREPRQDRPRKTSEGENQRPREQRPPRQDRSRKNAGGENQRPPQPPKDSPNQD